MKYISWILIMLIFLLWPLMALAQDTVPEAAPVDKDIWGLVWAFLNSPSGLAVIGFLLTFILGKVFTAKPKWKVYADKYRPLLIAAIKKAEKEIEDDPGGGNKGLARLDNALKYILEINAQLDKSALKEAITAVHAEAEKDKNL